MYISSIDENESAMRKNVALWALQSAVAAVFVAAAVLKVAGVPMAVQMFDAL